MMNRNESIYGEPSRTTCGESNRTIHGEGIEAMKFSVWLMQCCLDAAAKLKLSPLQIAEKLAAELQRQLCQAIYGERS